MYIRAPQCQDIVESVYGAKIVCPGVKLSEFLRGNLQILSSAIVPTESGADDRVSDHDCKKPSYGAAYSTSDPF